MSKTLTLLLLTSALAIGCQQDGSIGADGTIAALTRADDGAPPTTGDTAILWTVSSGSPDYDYLAGRGSVTAAGFEIALPASMPAAAINSYGVGVGTIVAFEAGTSPADGQVPDTDFTGTVTGATPNHAIIYIAPGASDGPEWADAFPPGFSCGVGFEIPGTFDGFEPIECALVELRFGDVNTFDFINWT